MKWIEIAKYIHCGEGESYIADIIDLMDKKIKSNEWVFPLSVIHMSETISRLDERTRQQLADVMGRFADNYTIVPYTSFYKQEFLNCILDLADYPNLKINIAERVINRDILGVVGSSIDFIRIESKDSSEVPPLHDELKRLLSNSKIFQMLAKEISSNELVTELRNAELDAVEKLELSRKQLHENYPNKDIRYRAFLGESFNDIYKDEFQYLALFAEQNKIAKNKIIPDSVFSSIESTIAFMQSVPSFHVRTELLYEIMNNLSHKILPNDNKDISFLSAAVPYCDVIITERTWTHVVKKRKLDVKYGTKISSQLDFLSSI